MNLFYLVFSCQFMVLWAEFPTYVESPRRSVIKLTTRPTKNEAVISILEPTDQQLATVNLPIWTVHENNPNELEKIEDVMQEVGHFTMYQDPATTAAAVFFHKGLELRGIIDSRAIIDRLFWDHKIQKDRVIGVTGVQKRKSSRFFADVPLEPQPEVSEQVDHFVDMGVYRKEEPSNEEIGVSRSRREIQSTVYIETLVIVNYDKAEELQDRPNEYSSIVSYILTLFNSVDMLYSKIHEPKIKFNLAGIIVGISPKAFPLHVGGECYKQIEDNDGKLVDHVDIRCVNRFIKKFCDKHARTIPPGTYDIAILLTSYGLHQYEYNPKTGNRKLKILGGLAESPKDDYYELMKIGTMPTLVATVSDRGEYESFPILAHEIAHLFDVEHDEPTGEKHKLMRPNGKHSLNSLSWSQASTESMGTFFRSRNSCIFKNKPGSLHPPGPHKTLNADQQCRCYGFKSAKIGASNRIRGTLGADCDANIQCHSAKGVIHDGPLFFDGTPCARNKVCWASDCVNIRK